MAKELIHVDKSRVGQLHCDNPRCGHVLGTPLEWGPQLIGLPCPRCDSNMLTRKDYESTERMFHLIAWVNKWFGWLGSEYSPDKFPATVGVRHHDGKVTFDLKD